jgi:hypothetical protein
MVLIVALGSGVPPELRERTGSLGRRPDLPDGTSRQPCSYTKPPKASRDEKLCKEHLVPYTELISTPSSSPVTNEVRLRATEGPRGGFLRTTAGRLFDSGLAQGDIPLG